MFETSCGSARKANNAGYNAQLQQSPRITQTANRPATPTRTARATEPCEALSWEKDFAAVGTAISYNEKVAREEAKVNAREELGRMMQVAVEGAVEDYLKNVSQNRKSTAETLFEEVNRQFYSECVKNSKVIKTTVYDLSDGTIQVFVCMEVSAGFDVLTNTADIAENVLSKDGALEVEFNKEQFKEKMKDGLQQYKENRGK